jgi:hypothetical protein
MLTVAYVFSKVKHWDALRCGYYRDPGRGITNVGLIMGLTLGELRELNNPQKITASLSNTLRAAGETSPFRTTRLPVHGATGQCPIIL